MLKEQKIQPVFLAGPTASGKTEVSLRLCQALDGEVVSADSMQIYKGLNIGTAKPAKAEQQGIPHHMLDIADFHEPWSVERYVQQASLVIEEVMRRGKTPVVAGGTGQYFDGLLWRRSFPPIAETAEIRKSIQAYGEKHGQKALFQLLRQRDPKAAENLHENNARRVIRALEICLLTGETASAHYEKTKSPPRRFSGPLLGICPADRAVLYRRIDKRVEEMLQGGLLEETKALFAAGLSPNHTAGQAIGYKELWPVLQGETTLAQGTEALKQATRRYAKRQMTWFNRMPVSWVFYGENEKAEDVAAACLAILAEKGANSEGIEK